MATRFYFPEATAPAVTVTPPAGWTHDSGVRRGLVRATPGSSTLTTTDYAPDSTDHTIAGAALHRLYVSVPLGAQTISGTVKLQFQCFMDNGNNALGITFRVYTVNNAGSTVTHTLLALNSTVTVMNTTAVRNYQVTARTITSATIAEGERLVVEIGSGNASAMNPGTGVQGHNAQFRYGETASSGDLPEDFTQTGTTYRPWIEFSATILPVPTGGDGSSPGVAAGSAAGAWLLWAASTATAGVAVATAVGEAVLSVSFSGQSQWRLKHFYGQHWQDHHWGGTDPGLHGFSTESQWKQRHFYGQHWENHHWAGTDPPLHSAAPTVQADGTSAGVAGGTGTAATLLARAPASAGAAGGQAAAAWRALVVGSAHGVAASPATGENGALSPVTGTHWARTHWAAAHWAPPHWVGVAAAAVASHWAAAHWAAAHWLTTPLPANEGDGTATGSASSVAQGAAVAFARREPTIAGAGVAQGRAAWRAAAAGAASGSATASGSGQRAFPVQRRTRLGLAGVAAGSAGPYVRLFSPVRSANGVAAGSSNVTGFGPAPLVARRTRLSLAAVAGRQYDGFQRGGVGVVEATGTAAGAATAPASGVSIVLGVGACQALSTAPALAAARVLAVGSAAGVATVSGAPLQLGINAADGRSDGVAAVSAISRVTAGVAGQSLGLATVTAGTVRMVPAVGSAPAAATISGASARVLGSVGASVGGAAGQVVGGRVLPTTGTSQGLGAVTGTAGLGPVAADGASVGTAAVTAVAAWRVAVVGSAQGTSTMEGGLPPGTANPPHGPRVPVHTTTPARLRVAMASSRRQSVTLRTSERLDVPVSVGSATLLIDEED